MRKEILKNKPASIEEFVIALCEARQEGGRVPKPVTEVSHRGISHLTAAAPAPKTKSLIQLKRSTDGQFLSVGSSSSDGISLEPITRPVVANLLSLGRLSREPSRTRLNRSSRSLLQSSFRDSFTSNHSG